MTRVPPALGEHTDEVLEELGYTAKEINALHSQEAV
jgi:crotonobetainyl-CoA:carnitine CoA-transferase CaiB-like acyl-CoA transferase